MNIWYLITSSVLTKDRGRIDRRQTRQSIQQYYVNMTTVEKTDRRTNTHTHTHKQCLEEETSPKLACLTVWRKDTAGYSDARVGGEVSQVHACVRICTLMHASTCHTTERTDIKCRYYY